MCVVVDAAGCAVAEGVEDDPLYLRVGFDEVDDRVH